jgi:hypothetical protein
MSTDFSEDDQSDLERLLDGRADDVRSARLRRLTGLLGAAAAPARPHELRGEGEALAAFRAARRDSAVARRVRIALPTAKVAAAVVAIVLGSAAAAMATGLVPPLLDTRPQVLTHASARVSPTGGDGDDGPRTSSAAPVRTASALPRTSVPAPEVGGPEPSESPLATSARMSGIDLCAAYLTLGESQRPRALSDTMFAPLVALADDMQSVDAYCGQILAPASPTPSPTPSSSSSPSPSSSPSSSSSPSLSPSVTATDRTG